MNDDDAFGWQMFNAIIRAYQMERPTPARAEPDPEPLDMPVGCSLFRHSTNGELRIRARVKVNDMTHTIAYYPPTPDGREQAGRCAQAARDARAAGLDIDASKAAGRKAGEA